jgi:hypothetical protein
VGWAKEGVVPFFFYNSQQPIRSFFVIATSRPALFLKTAPTDLKIF